MFIPLKIIFISTIVDLNQVAQDRMLLGEYEITLRNTIQFRGKVMFRSITCNFYKKHYLLIRTHPMSREWEK